MDENWFFESLKASENKKKTLSGLESFLVKLENKQKIFEELSELKKTEDELIDSRNNLKLEDLETRIYKIEENSLEKLIDLVHTCEKHTILLAQTQNIETLKSDLEEISYNITNDDRLNNLSDFCQNKLASLCTSLEKIGQNLEKINPEPINQNLQYLHRKITEENIKKQQEFLRLEIIQDQIDQILRRCDSFLPISQEMEMEQELFLQRLSDKNL